jgi:hypothetical protein
MTNNDYSEFQQEWIAANECSVNGKVLSERAMSMIFEDFEQYTLHTIKSALTQHRKICKFAPTTADILTIINPSLPSPHIGADEAWTIAKLAMDENNSVVTTQEIMTAFDICWDLFNSGDETGARMAFRDGYNRIVGESRKAPEWFMSTGSDKTLTEGVARKAVELGRLPAGSENKYRLEKTTATVAGLIEGYVARVDVRESAMAGIKALLAPVAKKKRLESMDVETVYSRTTEALPKHLLDVDNTYYKNTDFEVA